MSEIDSYLSKLEFWEHLSDEQLTHLERGTSIRSYEQGGLVFDSGSACLGLVYIISGGIRTYMMSDEGKEVTLYRLGAGECCILSASCVIKEISFDSYMTAEKNTRLAIVNAGEVQYLSRENIYFRCFTYELATKRFSDAMRTMDKLLFLKLEQRLAGFLLSEYDRTGMRQLRMTHEQVAQYINSAREVVAKTLKRFSAEGLVEVKRGVISLKDIDGLRDIS